MGRGSKATQSTHAVSGRLRLTSVEPHFLEQVGDQRLEIPRGELHEVRPGVESPENITLLNKPRIYHVELKDGSDGDQFGRALGD